MKQGLTILIALSFLSASTLPARAQTSAETLPVFPPSLQLTPSQQSIRPMGCRREFTLSGKTYRIDSYHNQDGEGLRPFVRDVPEANQLLNDYQSNRTALATSAYIGTLGLLAGLLGPLLVGALVSDETAALRVGQIVRIAGFGLTLGAAGYSIGILRGNESKLEEAVQKRNLAFPQQPIQLLFTAEGFF